MPKGFQKLNECQQIGNNNKKNKTKTRKSTIGYKFFNLINCNIGYAEYKKFYSDQYGNKNSQQKEINDSIANIVQSKNETEEKIQPYETEFEEITEQYYGTNKLKQQFEQDSFGKADCLENQECKYECNDFICSRGKNNCVYRFESYSETKKK
eukprot:226361_1